MMSETLKPNVKYKPLESLQMGIPKETFENERRVAMTPAAVICPAKKRGRLSAASRVSAPLERRVDLARS